MTKSCNRVGSALALIVKGETFFSGRCKCGATTILDRRAVLVEEFTVTGNERFVGWGILQVSCRADTCPWCFAEYNACSNHPRFGESFSIQ